jgi:hypothetical protein
MKVRSWYLKKFGWIPRPVRQVIILVIGGTLLLLGLLGMVLPVMPGFIFIPFALAVLAAEFAWAARWLLHIRKSARNIQDKARNGTAIWPARVAVRFCDSCASCWRRTFGSSDKPACAPPPILTPRKPAANS